MEIFYFAKFEKQFKKMSQELKLLTLEKEEIFKIDPFDVRLKTHKLHGRFSNYFAFSVSYKIRIIFSYEDNKKDVRFHSIGTHDIYE